MTKIYMIQITITTTLLNLLTTLQLGRKMCAPDRRGPDKRKPLREENRPCCRRQWRADTALPKTVRQATVGTLELYHSGGRQVLKGVCESAAAIQTIYWYWYAIPPSLDFSTTQMLPASGLLVHRGWAQFLAMRGRHGKITNVVKHRRSRAPTDQVWYHGGIVMLIQTSMEAKGWTFSSITKAAPNRPKLYGLGTGGDKNNMGSLVEKNR